jgi:hypothetical protein
LTSASSATISSGAYWWIKTIDNYIQEVKTIDNYWWIKTIDNYCHEIKTNDNYWWIKQRTSPVTR